jgi:4-nitrophenyl phosphatase
MAAHIRLALNHGSNEGFPRTWVLDLDGVGFCTNNSSELIEVYESKLAAMGIAAVGDVVSSALAAASLIAPGERTMVCGGPGVEAAVRERGAIPVDPESDEPVDSVIVGMHRNFSYGRLHGAMRALDRGARFLATNNDPRYPTAEGAAPGAGALLAAVEAASGRTAEIAGKPHSPMAQLVQAKFGADGIFVGDTIDTDGFMADALGWPFGLVLSGNSGSSAGAPSGAIVATNLADLVETIGTSHSVSDTTTTGSPLHGGESAREQGEPRDQRKPREQGEPGGLSEELG